MFLTLKCREFECQSASVQTASYDELVDAIHGGWFFSDRPDDVPTSEEVTAAQVCAALVGKTLQWICPDCSALLECR
jgi:hypothetical protein